MVGRNDADVAPLDLLQQAFPWGGLKLEMLQAFVQAAGPLKNSQLWTIVEKRGWGDPEYQTAIEISRQGNRLRVLLGLGQWNPLPCLGYGVEGRWLIHLPAWLNHRR